MKNNEWAIEIDSEPASSFICFYKRLHWDNSIKKDIYVCTKKIIDLEYPECRLLICPIRFKPKSETQTANNK